MYQPSQPPVKQTVVEQPKTKQSEFANLDAFLGSPSSSPASTHQTTTTSASQLQGADFFFGTSTSPPSQQQQQQQKQAPVNNKKSASGPSNGSSTGLNLIELQRRIAEATSRLSQSNNAVTLKQQ